MYGSEKVNIQYMGCFTSLSNNIYIVADPIPVDVDHAVHSCGPTMINQRIITNRSTYFKSQEAR